MCQFRARDSFVHFRDEFSQKRLDEVILRSIELGFGHGILENKSMMREEVW
jgi:hypothetical protein